jgi:hypothetical protein
VARAAGTLATATSPCAPADSLIKTRAAQRCGRRAPFRGRDGSTGARRAPRLRRVVLISLDGLTDIYRRARDLDVRVPNLERLAREGTSADGMQGVFPSATYPSHTTLITGVRPARHGVHANTVFVPEGEPSWYWYADSLRATTLPQAVTAAGRTVGVSCWPALVGASWVRWHLPEIWSLGARDATSREKVLRWATPGLVGEVEERFGEWTDSRFEWGAQDDRITDGAVYLIEAKRPQLLLVHLVEVDHVLHGAGRDAPEALRAFEIADRQIGRILEALEDADLRDSTNVVVVGDHGFANVHTEFRPNVVLARAGLLGAEGAGEPTWRVRARPRQQRRSTCATLTPGGVSTRRGFDALAAGTGAGVFECSASDVGAYGAFPSAHSVSRPARLPAAAPPATSLPARSRRAAQYRRRGGNRFIASEPRRVACAYRSSHGRRGADAAVLGADLGRWMGSSCRACSGPAGAHPNEARRRPRAAR